MINRIESLMGEIQSGNVDTGQIGQAAAQHVQSMDPQAVQQHLQTAAQNASQNGNEGLAQQIQGLLSANQGNPQGLKDEAVNFIKNNPQIIQHFAPEFAQGLLGKIGL
jgi:hypothetical protein